MNNNTADITCLGVVMDGNRRWAKARGVSTLEGHTEGYKRLQDLMRWARAAGIPHVAAYAFSTENWKRSEKEVGNMMKLFGSVLKNEAGKMFEERVRVRFVGDLTRFSDELQELMAATEKKTEQEYDITLHLLVSYGGRAEIVAAANALLSEGVSTVTEESFAQKLWSYPMPDPDLVIRTGARERLSNFLPWQSVYSELFFSDSFWPDLTKEEFDRFVAEYHARKRSFGV
ncbi:MAG: polyprenyl diphosphate synthase [Minisyncoccota bacterium]